MNSRLSTAPLYREVRLRIQDIQDVLSAEAILNGITTVSQVAESRGQDITLFDGDGDVIILSYSSTTDGNSLEAASLAVGGFGNQRVHSILAPALKRSKAAVEISLQYCNLDADAIIVFADAVRYNKNLVGFSVTGNPGNNTKDGQRALRRACMETSAPIQWFQGQYLSDAMIKARKNHASIYQQNQLSSSNLKINTSKRQVALMQLKENLFVSIDDDDARDQAIDQVIILDLDSKLKRLISPTS